jgi:hypothetical protein
MPLAQEVSLQRKKFEKSNILSFKHFEMELYFSRCFATGDAPDVSQPDQSPSFRQALAGHSSL